MAAPTVPHPPSFFDRSDGTDPTFGGTATPPEALLESTSDGQPAWEEDPESPQIEFAEQGTVRHIFHTEYHIAESFSNGLKRGTILVDSTGRYSRILSTSVNSRRGDKADLIVVAESLMTADIPPDEFSIDPIEFNPTIYKHPRYFIYQPTNPKPFVILTPYDLFFVQSRFGAGDFFTQQAFQSLIDQIPNPSDPDNGNTQTSPAKRKAAAQELARKVLLGIEAPYIPAFRVTFSKYFFYGAAALNGANVDPNLNPGGYIEDPTTVIPPDFWSIDGSGSDETNILVPFQLGGAMDTSKTPTFYDFGISWLREADSIVYQRTWFRLTSTWIGGPIGHWDVDLYSNQPSPYLP